MIESQHAGYRSRERNPAEVASKFEADKFERVVRLILVVCFMAVLGLEIWLLFSALGSA